MAKFTLLELHFNDSELAGSATYGPGEKDVEASEELPDEETSSKKGKLLAALVGLVFLVAVAYVVKTNVLGDEEVDVEAPDSGLRGRVSRLRDE